MRKVLLATTALVAMSVTAAQADLSISGNYEWEYTTNDTGTAWGDDGHINIKSVNAADNGMTFTAVSVLTNSADATTGANMEAAYIKVDGELMHTLITDSSMQKAVEGIVRAAGERGIKTVAERVENANAMAVLFQLGLDFMQGHYVHEPEVVLEDTNSGNQITLEDLVAANAN